MITLDDYVNAVALRMRETEAESGTRLTLNVPYFIQSELQYIVYEALTQTIREVPNEDWQGLSSFAIWAFSTPVASGFPGVGAITLPLNTARIIGITVDGNPSVASSPASFIQALTMTGGRWTNRWTAIEGKIMFIGANAIVTVLVEPTFTQWLEATSPILPPGYDIRAVDLAHKRVLIADYVPAWRP